MKLRLISTLVPILMFSGGAGAAEIYNTDGNKLDLNGKIVGVHYFDNNNTDSDHSYMRFGFLGEMQIRGGDEGVDAGSGGCLECFARDLDVLRQAVREVFCIPKSRPGKTIETRHAVRGDCHIDVRRQRQVAAAMHDG